MELKYLPETQELQGSSTHRSPGGRAGFTLVEVIIAIVILAVGLLGTAGTTLLVVKQTTLSNATTERAVALQSTIERLRALPFDSVRTGRDSVGAFDITWTVTAGGRWKSLNVVTTGPGLSSKGGYPILSYSIPDTFTYRIVR